MTPVTMALRQTDSSYSRFLSRGLLGAATLLISVGFSGCFLSSSKIELEKGQKSVESRDFKAALDHFEKLMKHEPQSDNAIEAAKEGARVAYYELKDYRRAIDFFRHLILYAKKSQDREEAQQKIAEVYFSNLQDYKQAIIEYNRLLDLPHTKEQGLQFEMAVARSYFYLNNFFQALTEAEEVLKEYPDTKGIFDAMELKANILMQTKRYDEAVEVLKTVIEKFPDQAKERQTGLVLTVVYEEKKDFAKAVETLESIKNSYPNRAFIEERIKNLKERQSYLPGAKGLRK